MYRFRPRYNKDVNQYWMCDEGRLWYKELQKESRIVRPAERREEGFATVTWAYATAHVTEALTRAKTEHGASAIAGIVGAKATNEEAYLFSSFLKEQIGSAQIAGLSWSPAGAFHDDFLIKADKNPNTRGLQALGLLNGGASAADILTAAEKGTIKVLLVFGADLVSACDQKKLDKALSDVTVIVCDTDYTGTSEHADLILPIATVAETDGTFTNHAGRVQRVRQAFPPPGEAKPGWEALSQLGVKFGGTNYLSSAEVFAELANKNSAFAGLTYSKLSWQGVRLAEVPQSPEGASLQS
jgi:NADH-quinone oxidoreductase subunit G